jgi:hypothetical protein
LKASVEILKEKALKVKESLGGAIPADWKIQLGKQLSQVEFIKALNNRVQ